jgi:hypothetical protein
VLVKRERGGTRPTQLNRGLNFIDASAIALDIPESKINPQFSSVFNRYPIRYVVRG